MNRLQPHVQVHAAEQAARLRLREAQKQRQEAAAAAEASHRSQALASRVLGDLEQQQALLAQQVGRFLL